MITQEELAKLAHISDAEAMQDIADTLAEIRSLRAKANEAQEGISQRLKFIAKVRAVLAARKQEVDA